jgi:hypothetical protein
MRRSRWCTTSPQVVGIDTATMTVSDRTWRRIAAPILLPESDTTRRSVGGQRSRAARPRAAARGAATLVTERHQGPWHGHAISAWRVAGSGPAESCGCRSACYVACSEPSSEVLGSPSRAVSARCAKFPGRARRGSLEFDRSCTAGCRHPTIADPTSGGEAQKAVSGVLSDGGSCTCRLWTGSPH